MEQCSIGRLHAANCCFQIKLMTTTHEISTKRKKMNDSETLEDADLKQFDKLFVELVAESTSDAEEKIADAMQWFKRVSGCTLRAHKIRKFILCPVKL